MKSGLDRKICEAFPLLYADRHGPKTDTCMYWGFPGDGWYELIWKLSYELERVLEGIKERRYLCACGHFKREHRRSWKFWENRCTRLIKVVGETSSCSCKKFKPVIPRAVQVKEKFGTLSFYMTHLTPQMRNILSYYKKLSAHTCESCGSEEGRQCYSGWSGMWVKTYCKECEEKEKIKIAEGKKR